MTKNIRLSLVVLAQLSALSAGAAAPPSAWVANFDQAQGETLFHAVGHPSALNINGHGEVPKGQLRVEGGKITGTLTLNLASLDTGIGTRTSHMKEKYLEVEKYPQAKLVLDGTALPAGAAEKDSGVYDGAPFTGKLTLHGVEKPVHGTAHIERKGARASIDATFSVDITDYKIEQPKFAGITIDKDVALEIKADIPLIK